MTATSYLLDLLGIRVVDSDGEPVPQSKELNFVAPLAAAYNPATKRIDVTGGGASNGVEYETMDDLRDVAPVNGIIARTSSFSVLGDGGGGTWRGVTGASPGTYTHNGGTVIVPSGGNGSAAWLREFDGTILATWFGTLTSATIQAAINDGYNRFSATTKRHRVELPAGEFTLGASAETTLYLNDGTPITEGSMCLVLYEGVDLVGAGRSKTVLRSNDPDLTVVMMLARDGGEVSGLTVDGQWAGTGAGHGIFTVSRDGDETPILKNVKFRDIFVTRVGSYGIGLQAGDTDNVTLENIRIEDIGADGLDLKCRGATHEGPALFLNNISVKAHGKRVVGSAGIDVRGRARITNYYCYDVGTTDQQQSGFRFRTKSAEDDDAWAQYSTLTNFYIECNDIAGVVGMQIGSANCTVANGIVRGAVVAVGGNAEATPDNVVLSDVIVLDAPEYGFEIGPDVQNATLVGCKAPNATTAGFRNEADYTTFIGCSAPGAAAVYSTSSAAAPTEKNIGRNGANWLTEASGSSFAELIAKGDDTNVDVRVTPKGTGAVELRSRGFRSFRAANPSGTLVNWLETNGSATTEAPAFIANGSDSNISIKITPKGTGKLRYGTWTSTSDVAITGYLEIEDSGGTVRKLAIIS